MALRSPHRCHLTAIVASPSLYSMHSHVQEDVFLPLDIKSCRTSAPEDGARLEIVANGRCQELGGVRFSEVSNV